MRPSAGIRDPSSDAQTLEGSWSQRRMQQAAAEGSVPGLVMVFSGGEATLLPIPLKGGVGTLGRGDIGGVPIDDDRMSRRHVDVAFDGERWRIRDHASRNGTYVDGLRVDKELAASAPRVLRIGDSLFTLLGDIRPFQGARLDALPGVVIGPSLREGWSSIEAAARDGDTLHLWGESGTGKELAARHFHSVGPRRSGPFIAINCAAIPPNLAERLLFGARKGAYSGATDDVQGYLQAADSGTLFFDEIAELDASVQAKLLRVLESKEVLPLGASQPRRVDLAVCSATQTDLRSLASAGSFREDLFFRIGRPVVALPPLRSRIEDIPWLVQSALKGLSVRPHMSLVEACLTRRWPGNVRELLGAVRAAASEATRRGLERVDALTLEPTAGEELGSAPVAPAARVSADDEAAVLEALRAQGGNVTAAARALGWHRTQLRRWMGKRGMQARLPTHDEDTAE